MLQNKYIFPILIISLLVVNCTRRPKEILKPSEMTRVLVDIHIADGIFSISDFKKLSNEEKALYYQSILVKHNTTQAQFDSSVVWYSHDPKQFEKIYNKVTIQLTKYEEDVKNGKYDSLISKDTLPHLTEINIWNQPTKFEFNGNRNRSELHFVITDSTLMTQDSYLLSFRQQIQPSDTCNQRAILYIHYANGETDSIFKELHSDGKLRKYTLRLIASHYEIIDSLSGYLLASGMCPKVPQTTYTDSISLIRFYNISNQKELKEKIKFIKDVKDSPYWLIKDNKNYLYPFINTY